MSSQSWTVNVDHKPHEIRVDYDWQLGKATIRVDGRIAVKPLGSGETEREVPVDSAMYVIKRLEDDTFDLDLLPGVLPRSTATGVKRPTMAQPKPERSGGLRIGMILGGIVVLVIVAAFIRVGRQGFQYMRVPWKSYSAPDNTFKAKFPEQPEEQTQSRNINGDIWNVVSLTSHYKDHFYAVQYVDLHMVVIDANQRPVMERFFNGWMKAFGATIVNTEDASLARNPTIEFVARIPAGAGEGDVKLPVPALMRGVEVLRDKRLFLVWTLAAEKDPFSTDLREFKTSFDVPPPPERPHYVM